ncbi:hypothetical protein D9619_012885 [Psilocybe cf. subviscida]|uniref:Short-chain dehydrogenase n=1 Tax=Psilocybe cf. subviscida TaxID=2480587 RepID=A0A8H5BHW9_9AGAR|nr:hypothetical protein D9619_012885 [Psilocybe cf. subviscida]
MHYSFGDFLREQRKKTPPLVSEDLTGKTVVVTGSNVGLGFEATKHFARMNPGRLIMACRNMAYGEVAMAKIKEETGCQIIELWVLDLSSFASVIAFYERFERDGGRLDILVENAAVIPNPKDAPTTDGWAPGIQVNILATNLLALLLLPRLVHTAKEHNTVPRLVVVASDVHYRAKIPQHIIDAPKPWRAYNDPKSYRSGPPFSQYNDSKLFNVLFVRALAERFSFSTNSVIVDCVNPGFCASELRRGLNPLLRLGDKLFVALVARTTEEGSRQLVYAALGGKRDERKLHGAYISLSEIREPSDFVLSEDGRRAQERFWDDMIVEFTKVEPRVQDIVQTLFNKA